MFKIANIYTKKDLYDILQVPKVQRRGSWDTGYRIYNGNIYIFSNVGIPGRTGHDYNNYWDGDLFVWEGKRGSHIRQPLIKKMLQPDDGQKIFLFTRTRNRDPYTFEGEVAAKDFVETIPVKITWMFAPKNYPIIKESIYIINDSGALYEGKPREITLTKHERNPLARRMCIEHFGCFCQVCNFDFFKHYGELGKGYIQVHHKTQISSMGDQHQIDPENDLIPVCPNCHVMLHFKDPCLTVEELRNIINCK